MRIDFYLPTNTPNKTECLDNAVACLTDICGGCTSVEGMGHWRASNGVIVVEPVHVLTGVVYPELHADGCTAIEALAKDVCRLAEQECVLYCLNNIPHFVYFEEEEI